MSASHGPACRNCCKSIRLLCGRRLHEAFSKPEAVESLLDSGSVGAANQTELALISQLRDTITPHAGSLRLPATLPPFDELEGELNRLDSTPSC